MLAPFPPFPPGAIVGTYRYVYSYIEYSSRVCRADQDFLVVHVVAFRL